MNRQQLQCFLCTADKLNFTKAAEELYLSTPTVTHHIKSLEEELNTTLFIRTTRMVKLTEAGTVFYNDAKEILAKMDIAEKRVHKMTSKKTTFIKIGCSSNTEVSYMKSTLEELHRAFPNVYPQIIVNDYFFLKNLFNNGQLDIVFATKEMIKDMQNCSFHKIKEIENYAVMSQSLCKTYGHEVLFEELEAECLITLHPRLVPFQYGNKLQENITLHSQSHFHIICENDQAGILLAKCGYGVAILPAFCIPWEQKDVFALPIVHEDNALEYGIAYHKKTNVDYVRYFIKQYSI